MLEIIQWLFILGSLLTILVNTASIKQLTWRIEDLEQELQHFRWEAGHD